MLTITGPSPKQLLKIQENKLLILLGATWEDYWTLSSEDLKLDFIQDRIYIHSPANADHEEIFGFLLTEIRNYLKSRDLGKILGSRFPIETVDGRRIEPDLVFLSKKSIKNGEFSKTLFKGSPSWIIEIISPNYEEHDTVTKRNEYRLLNVEEYWIIDLENKNIEIIKFKNQKEVHKEVKIKSSIKPAIEGFKEFSINLTDIWKRISEDKV